jgi:hypothetical protein
MKLGILQRKKTELRDSPVVNHQMQIRLHIFEKVKQRITTSGRAQWLKPVVLGTWRSGGSWFKTSQGKKFRRLHLNQ